MKKTALITGASTGIGYELSKIAARNGYNLILIARNKNKLEEVAKEIKLQTSVDIKIIPTDLSKPDSVKKIIQSIKKEPVELLINNAGFGINQLFHKNKLEDEIELLQVNIQSLVSLTHYLIPSMIENKNGFILNLASTAAFLPGPRMASYYASKAFVLSFSEALTEELSTFGIKVSVLCPGATKTEFTKRAHMDDSKLFKGMLANVMSAEDVANAGFFGVMRGKAIIIPGFMNQLLAFSTRTAPRILLRKISGFLNQSV